jgi:hypothetical protein
VRESVSKASERGETGKRRNGRNRDMEGQRDRERNGRNRDLEGQRDRERERMGVGGRKGGRDST